ncbi:hypothetical protein LCGC14_3019800, partial [marine sediment metagenome]
MDFNVSVKSAAGSTKKSISKPRPVKRPVEKLSGSTNKQKEVKKPFG